MVGVYMASAPKQLSALVKWEGELSYSRDALWLAADPNTPLTVDLGTVLGRRLLGAPAAVPAGAGQGGVNTGTGVLSQLALGPAAVAGVYRLLCVAANADPAGATFALFDPAGYRLRDHAAGPVASAGEHLRFKLALGATGWVVGDGFALTVPAGDGKAVPIDFAATDGSQIAAGILLRAATLPPGIDTRLPVLTRMALIAASQLVWPTGATGPQKAQALDQLSQLSRAGILAREEA